MGFIEAALKSAKSKDDKLLAEIGKKLPKKVRKKLRWKKIAPILSLLITIFSSLSRSRAGRPKAQPTAPANKRPNVVPAGRPAAPAKRFSDASLQSYVEQAEAYQAEITRLAQNPANANNQSRLQEMASHVQAWTLSITTLAHRIEEFRQNKLIGKDLKEVPKSIANLEERLAREANPSIKTELERTVTNRRQQLASLQKLQHNIQMAEIKIESTLSMLGTIYSQILAGQSTRQVADYRRLLNEIDEEVHTLQDHLEALEEVKLARI